MNTYFEDGVEIVGRGGRPDAPRATRVPRSGYRTSPTPGYSRAVRVERAQPVRRAVIVTPEERETERVYRAEPVVNDGWGREIRVRRAIPVN